MSFIDDLINLHAILDSYGDRIYTTFLDFYFNIFDFLFNIFFGWINIPPFPEDLKQALYSFFDLIFDNLSLLGFFVRLSTLNILINVFLLVFNIRIIYKFIMWIINKIKLGGGILKWGK